MPEPTPPAAEPTPQASPQAPAPFDVGDTELYPLDTVATQAASPEPARPLPDRNPDGTFKPKASEHPSWLAEKAREFGYDDDTINSIPTTALHRVVFQAQAERLKFQSENASQRTVEKNTVQTPPPAEPQFPGDLSHYDDQTQGAFKALWAEVLKARKIAEDAQAQAGGLRQSLEQRDNETRDQFIDRVIVQHGSPEKVGSDRLGRCPPAQQRIRKRIFESALEIAGPNPTLDRVVAAIPEAIKELNFAKPAAPVAPATNGHSRITPEQWAAGGLAEPTGRQGGPEPKGDKLAVENLARKMQDAGLTGDSEIMDTLLK